ncbi:MAG: hypothetical protein II311_02625 [Lachnospiraceae bacterium]|nr:hypothetical protein [Lachnospiraceae bacterium]
MAAFTPVTGIITNIEYLRGTGDPVNDCTILFTLEGENPAGAFQVQLPANAYVLNLHPFQSGDRATFFYDANAPMVLIYPMLKITLGYNASYIHSYFVLAR